MKKGKFIVFDGGEGSGKTTQLELAAKWLYAHQIPTWSTREPGGTKLGQQLREILLHDQEVSPIAELLLYQADRAQHVLEIKKRLHYGIWVLCDRFTLSTLAYQGAGRYQPTKMIEQLNEISAQGLEPDWTFLLDIDPAIGLTRKGHQQALDKFEQEAISFHQRVRECYLEIAHHTLLDYTIICAQQGIESVSAPIHYVLSNLAGVPITPATKPSDAHLLCI
ncbi:dTMP kinase [Nodularia phage vB_NspS-kac65v162]|jgi:dTMP kinase|uniref:dTMP kinase n=2 Tax=Ravarandavirus kac65v151 TaxID=2845689 RepID=A0A482MJY5_9CAUD|nr:thymidylate kinase [Nodularia phage vB_NspS-kac65v151]QBQ73198.1 dTMP kinase [Nodularia phage vB_NspS-kac65v151]QBQ73612.1 dTMP kinase [Nodularia phage vB_NspS-kac65v162]